MLFGHNTDVKVGETVYHLQTEDRGTASALIDTTVYCRGRVLHRRTNNYFDLLPLDSAREESLKKRIAEQHRSVGEEIRSGALRLMPPPPSTQEFPPAQKPAPAPLLQMRLPLLRTPVLRLPPRTRFLLPSNSSIQKLGSPASTRTFTSPFAASNPAPPSPAQESSHA